MQRVILAVAVLWGISAWTGPFGVEMGQPVEGTETAEGGLPYENLDPPSGFVSLSVYGTAKSGACQVRVLKAVENADSHGQSLRSAVGQIENTLTGKYGNPTNDFDFLHTGSIWKDPEDWMMGLYRNERTLSRFWTALDSTQYAGVAAISLQAKATSSRTGVVVLTYQLANYESCTSEAKAAHAEQF